MEMSGRPPAKMLPYFDVDLLPDSHIIGVQIIDQQHQELLELLARLCQVQEPSANSASVADALALLMPKMIEHFDTEEDYMKSCGMPPQLLSEHVMEHTKIVEELSHLQMDLIKQSAIKVSDLIDSARSWIFDHITRFDIAIKNVRHISAQVD